jgi:hypothetical protein
MRGSPSRKAEHIFLAFSTIFWQYLPVLFWEFNHDFRTISPEPSSLSAG